MFCLGNSINNDCFPFVRHSASTFMAVLMYHLHSKMNIHATIHLTFSQETVAVLSGGAPAGTSVFSKHNWDMEMGYL